MIIAHSIIGMLPVSNNEFSWYWFVGSIIPDIDHFFVLFKNKFFSWRKFSDSIRFEDKYGIHYKTRFSHSVLGAIIASAIVLLINLQGAMYFFSAFIVHLLIDWPDCDEKQYLYPLKIKFRGFLPIFSKLEIAFTITLIILALVMYLG